MKKTGVLLPIIATLFLFSHCSEKSKNTTITTTDKDAFVDNFDWLLGKWKRNNEEDGKETFENWRKKSSTEYIGLGFTMQDGDTLKQEKIWLVKSDNSSWDLIVQPQDEPAPITFHVTSYNEQEFVSEKKDHDFPKLIKYWKNNDQLNAIVSGDGMEIPFEFIRLNE